jgi:hypothetical protein
MIGAIQQQTESAKKFRFLTNPSCHIYTIASNIYMWNTVEPEHQSGHVKCCADTEKFWYITGITCKYESQP